MVQSCEFRNVGNCLDLILGIVFAMEPGYGEHPPLRLVLHLLLLITESGGNVHVGMSGRDAFHTLASAAENGEAGTPFPPAHEDSSADQRGQSAPQTRGYILVVHVHVKGDHVVLSADNGKICSGPDLGPGIDILLAIPFVVYSRKHRDSL